MKSSTGKSATRRRAKEGDGEGRKLVSQIELLRMRVAAAATAWKQAKEHASQAKRRRKLAKLLAKRARKDARTARANLDELRATLTEAQTRAADPWQAAVRHLNKSKRTRATSKRRPATRRAVVRKTLVRDASSQPPPAAMTETAENMINNPIDPASVPVTSAAEIPAST